MSYQMNTEHKNVLDAAKGWYRNFVRGIDVSKRKAAVRKLPPHLRRLAQMVANMEEAEKRDGVRALARWREGRSHLNLVKGSQE